MKPLFYLLYALCFVLAFLALISLAVQSNTISSAGPGKHFFTAIAPQGWGFFTRSPKDDNVDIYLLKNSAVKLVSYPNASYRNYFGGSRKSRTIGMEISVILGKLKTVPWDTVTVNTPVLDTTKVVHHIDSKWLFYLSKGEYLLVKKPIVPWAWYGNENNFIPYETIHIQVN